MAESVDALVSNTNDRKVVPVRPRLRVLKKSPNDLQSIIWRFYFVFHVRNLSALPHLKTLVSQIRKIAAIVDKFSILESSLFNQILQRIQHDYSVILSMICLIYNNVNQILPNQLYYNPLKGRS